MAFKNDSDAELIGKSASVVQALTQDIHAYIISLLPNPERVQRNHNNYSASYAAVLAGDHGKAQECEEHRSAVNQDLTILLGVAKALYIKDPKVQEALGLPTTPNKAASSSGALSKPEGFKVYYDPDGNLVASVTKVQSARGYQIWVCDSDPNSESNWRLGASSPSCRRIVIPGLEHGKSNWLKIRAMGGKGTAGPWSNLVYLSPK